jgi:hypothetical protein
MSVTWSHRRDRLRGRRASPAPRRLWALATAPTTDGVTAHVRVDFTLQPGTGTAYDEELDMAVMDRVEARLRQEVGRRPVADLPVVGDSVDWVPTDLVPGATILDVHVVGSDVEVTPELRRLVSPGRPVGAWT